LKKNKVYFNFFVFLLFVKTIFPQDLAEISGLIKNAITGKTLSNVNVYIANTTIGTITNSSGYFQIVGIAPGFYRLVISSVGYSIIIKSINIKSNRKYRFAFLLKPKIYQLPTVTVKDYYDKNWRDNFEIFRKQFLGFSNNALQCKISNPFIIDFQNKNDTLIATAKEPLKIVNNALGYSITYFLKSFKYFDNTVRFSGLPIFKELKTNKIELKLEWKKRRLKTYCGSLRHFLTTLFKDYEIIFNRQLDSLKLFVNDNFKSLLEEEGFELYEIDEQKIGERVWFSRKKIFSPRIVFTSGLNNEYLLSTSNPLLIKYNRKLEDKNYLEFIGRNGYPETPTSFIILHSKYVHIDKQGRYFDKYKLETKGYWAFERLADMLPFNYTAPDSIIKLIDFTR